MKLTFAFLGLAAARDLAMGSASGNLLDPAEQSMGAGIVNHATDDMYNQLSKAPTPAPSGDADMHAAAHAGTCQAYIPTDCTAAAWPAGLNCDTVANTVLAKRNTRCFHNNWSDARCCEEGYTCYQRQNAAGQNLANWGNCKPTGQNVFRSDGVTLLPGITPWPAWVESKGTTAQIDAQTGVDAVPTKNPTAFPTKDTSHDFGTDDSRGADNTADQCCFGNGPNPFCRPVGFVGAGPNRNYCNIFRCAAGTVGTGGVGKFVRTRKTCSIEEQGNTFCSHTTCTFEGTPQVIKVHSDHREEVGGSHKCGFSKTSASSALNRPACDCICMGARRQDANGFARKMKEINSSVSPSSLSGNRFVTGNHDPTTNYDNPNQDPDFDASYNHNNFYSQHSNTDETDLQNKFANINANTQAIGDVVNGAQGNSRGISNGDGTTTGIDTTMSTQYNENDQKYNGQRVAHLHINTNV